MKKPQIVPFSPNNLENYNENPKNYTPCGTEMLLEKVLQFWTEFLINNVVYRLNKKKKKKHA